MLLSTVDYLSSEDVPQQSQASNNISINVVLFEGLAKDFSQTVNQGVSLCRHVTLSYTHSGITIATHVSDDHCHLECNFVCL